MTNTRKNILITGASSGLGAGMAREFAARGRDLALCARRTERLESLKAELLAAHPGIRISLRELDVNQYDDVFTVFRAFAEEFGGLDRVIVNAGIGKGKPVGTGYFWANRQTAETNFVAALAQCEAAVEIFRAQGHGHLVMISSMSAMRGMPGNKVIEANAGGRPLRELDYHAGQPGQDLYLSIDAKLQSVAEQALGDLDGAAVAIDPKTGEVLALVSKPGFAPAPFVEGIDNDSYHALLDDPDRPLYNRAMLGAYPSGSTIKPFLALGGLHYGTINPEKPVFDPGYFQLPGVARKYRCDKRTGHGWLNLDQAIAQSCDVYFYQAAVNLGIDHIDTVLNEFGFGHVTGIDVPNEKAGILPGREWKRRVYHQNWYLGETVNMGVGQGYFTVTPLELAQAAARLAMHGGGYKPHIVHAMKDPLSGNV